MRILLFGAAGWVGTRLSARLSAVHDIIGVVRRPPETPTDFTPLVCPDWVDVPSTVIAALEALAPGGRPVDATIAAVGGWYVDGPVLARGLGAFDADYDTYLRAHFTACRISAELAVDTHLACNGVASIEALSGSGAISVFGSAQQMLIRVADAESESVRFRELTILAPLSGDRRNDTEGGVVEIDIDTVTRAAESILTDPEPAAITTYLSPSA